MPISALVYFYARRLRTHPVQELLAGVGIAVGVALVFAVQVANSSITGGSGHVLRSVVGVADLQLKARGAQGIDERLSEKVRSLPDVALAAPVLDVNGTARGPGGRTVVQVASADPTLASLSGIVRAIGQSHLVPQDHALPEVVVPRAVASALGISGTLTAGLPKPAPVITLDVRGRATRVNVIAVLGGEEAGALANALAVIAPLEALQQMASMRGRITTVLVESRPGRRAQVRRELQALAGGRMSVAPATADLRLLQQASVPRDQATGFFAFVSALVGILLAFNAMLLSTPERRRMVADLRIQGTRPRDLAQLLLFQALCLGLVASLVGILLGDLLSHSIFHETPGYLALAFPLGTQTVVGWQPIVFALAGGVAATCLAACPPLLDLRRSRAVDAVYFEAGEPGQAMSRRTQIRLVAVAAGLLGVSAGLPSLFGPSASVVAIAAAAFAALLSIPFIFTLVVKLAEALASGPHRLNMLLMATRTLRATTMRSLALAATGAIAVYGTVAANGAHDDLLKGLYGDYGQYVSTADLWVASPQDDLATISFPAHRLATEISRVAGVREVRPYQGGFLDVAGRRVWLIARSSRASTLFPPGQVISGDARLATERVRRGGWIAASQQVAGALHAHVGGPITLPTPTGDVTYRLAATTSNLGWSAGAVVLDQADYAHAWADPNPSALEVDLAPGADASAVRRSIASLLGPANSLHVQTGAERASEADALAREGLERLTQIADLLTAAAILAMAAAMGASMWQRRPALASLRIQSFRPSQLRVILLYESGLVIATGCLVGAIAGVYGHALIDLYLRLVTGFPAPFSAALPQGLATVGAILGAAVAVLAVPGLMASRVPASLALQEHG